MIRTLMDAIAETAHMFTALAIIHASAATDPAWTDEERQAHTATAAAYQDAAHELAATLERALASARAA